ncbi:alpha/beta fold hydrolase [Pseudomaricurvus alkylphenolicus]|uniref:homoserine O-acetyltransferase family protein n=1 Tax=Pseudomaricurvus alkylphenolicus TaxID=1306991 RepID=UPI00142498A5|nr:alpha/beta fold hydrolase [Pseudomaricurvus alkylphenolicus]NIB38582.1 alpha/beta fold hydrolase [Pseudomaricurvus alkylphenolicus]
MITTSKTLTLDQPFVTQAGESLTHAVVAYEEYGIEQGPVIFVTHGGLSSHHAAGKYSEDDPLPGWWDGLIGPDKVFDTNRFRIICSNSLGSMYGSTGPTSIDPLTGCRYGPRFPDITLTDMVHFQKQFLQQLGITKLTLMAGPSMGSLQTLQMAALYPDFVGAAVAVATSGRMTPDGMTMHHLMRNLILMDPEFQAGWYHSDKPLAAMRSIAQLAKLYYMHENIFKKTCWDTIDDGPSSQSERSDAINRFLLATTDTEIVGRDPNSYLTILNAVNSHDLGVGQPDFASGVQRIQCPVLVMNIDTDREFSVFWGQELTDTLNQAKSGQAKLEVLKSDWGHMGCLKECEQMATHIGAFMRETGIDA